MAVHHHKLPIVTDGLIFQVDGANDLCDNVTNVKNIVTPTETGSFINQASVVNDAYEFDGVDDYIDFSGTDTSLDFSLNTPFTVSVWIYFTGGAIRTVMGKYSSNKRGWLINLNGTTLAVARFGVISNDSSYLISNTNILSVGWNNIVGTWSGGGGSDLNGVQTYRNAVNESTFNQANTPLSSINNSVTLKMGGDVENNRRYYDNKISKLSIYDRVLTQAEITQNYEALKHRFE